MFAAGGFGKLSVGQRHPQQACTSESFTSPDPRSAAMDAKHAQCTRNLGAQVDRTGHIYPPCTGVMKRFEHKWRDSCPLQEEQEQKESLKLTLQRRYILFHFYWLLESTTWNLRRMTWRLSATIWQPWVILALTGYGSRSSRPEATPETSATGRPSGLLEWRVPRRTQGV
jgi:hypothetical protein